jgi:hypothetical protein
MVLRDLLESARRDIYNQLDNTVIYTDPESGSEILLRLAAHLNDCKCLVVLIPANLLVPLKPLFNKYFILFITPLPENPVLQG